MAALQQPGELLGRLLAPGHELLARLQPGGQVLPLLYQAGQAGLLPLLGLPGLLGLPADPPGPPQLLLALGELGGLLGQGHRLPPQGGGLLPLPLGGLVGLLRLLVPLPGGGQGPGRRGLRLGEPFPLLPGLQQGLGSLDAFPQGGVFLPQGLDLPRLLLHRLGQGLRGVLALLAQQGLPQGRRASRPPPPGTWARSWNRSFTSFHTSAENKVRRMSPFSWELARSSRKNSPWGSTITWENCSQLRCKSSSARRRTALSLPLSTRANSPSSKR